MQRGGCHPTDGCQTGHKFKGADFKYLAANVVHKDDASTLFRPYTIRKFQGKKIGFIGMTLEGTPQIVAPSGISNLNFLDEAATANRYAQGAQAQARREGDRRAAARGRRPERPVQHQPGVTTTAASASPARSSTSSTTPPTTSTCSSPATPISRTTA